MPPETESSTTDRDAAAAREDSKAVPVGRWKRDKGYPLVHFSELPHWQQDNHYIHKGYRKASYSYIHSLHSILHWHNESVNIWTHMIPGLSAIPTAYLFYRELRPRYELASKNDVYVMLCFFLGAGAGMTLSGLYHTLSNHSPSVAKFWNQLDYVGIALMIWGSFVPSVYYGFWCDGGLRTRYWSMISVVGLVCIVATLHPAFRKPSLRPVRAAMFVAMGLSALAPVCHGLSLYGFAQTRGQVGLAWLVLQGVLYIIGATLYALRWPERVYPGRFDTLGASHQIFHLFVVLAAASHLKGLLVAFDYRHSIAGTLCL